MSLGYYHEKLQVYHKIAKNFFFYFPKKLRKHVNGRLQKETKSSKVIAWPESPQIVALK